MGERGVVGSAVRRRRGGWKCRVEKEGWLVLQVGEGGMVGSAGGRGRNI